MLTDTDKALYASEVSGVPTDASAGKSLDGFAWLKGLISTGVAGYVAVETAKAQVRKDNSVVTQDIPRVGDPAPAGSTIAPKTLYIVGGIIVAALALFLFMGRRR